MILEKRLAFLEIAFDILERTLNDLCREKNFDAAVQTRIVMTELLKLRNLIKGEEGR